MCTLGVSVDRPFIPISVELSEDRNILDDVDAYPVKACYFYTFSYLFTTSLTTWQVVLKRIDSDDDDGLFTTEVVHAKFVIGADGEWASTSRALSF
jgi:hypothetical protein